MGIWPPAVRLAKRPSKATASANPSGAAVPPFFVPPKMPATPNTSQGSQGHRTFLGYRTLLGHRVSRPPGQFRGVASCHLGSLVTWGFARNISHRRSPENKTKRPLTPPPSTHTHTPKHVHRLARLASPRSFQSSGGARVPEALEAAAAQLVQPRRRDGVVAWGVGVAARRVPLAAPVGLVRVH